MSYKNPRIYAPDPTAFAKSFMGSFQSTMQGFEAEKEKIRKQQEKDDLIEAEFIKYSNIGDLEGVSENVNNALQDGFSSIVDSKAFVDQIFVITRLNSLNESSAEFTAANWTQKLFDDLPRRKFYRNTCPWQYKGAECQYPSSGSGVISNTTPSSTANGYFTINNVTTTTASLDKCSKSVTACALRNNLQHFGGFPGVQDDL